MKVVKLAGKLKTVIVALTVLVCFASQAISGVSLSHKKGFRLSTEDGKFSLNIRLRAQLQGYTHLVDWKVEKAGFRVRRARIYFKGKAFSPLLKYYLQLTLEGGSLSLRDLYVEYPVAGSLLKVKAGQFKVPFNREYLTSSSSLELVERSLSNSNFEWGRDIGVVLHGVSESGTFGYALGVFSGEGKNAKPGDSRFLYAGRVVLGTAGSVKGSVWKNKQGAFERNFVFKAGAGVVFAEYKKSSLISDRADRSRYLKSITTPASILSVTGDAVFKFYPVAFEGDFNFVRSSALSSWWGARVQLSSFVWKRRLLIAGRYSYVDADSRLHEVTCGWSWFISGNHRFKLQNDYTYTIGDRDEFTARLQFQLYF